MVIIFTNTKKVSRNLWYNVLDEDLERVKSCPPWFHYFLLLFALCISISICVCVCVYICRHLKKGNIKIRWALYLSRNIHVELFRLQGMDYVALQFPVGGLNLTVKTFSLSKSREPQARMLPTPAEEAAPERGQQSLCRLITRDAGRAPARGGTEKEGSAATQTKGVCYMWMCCVLYDRFWSPSQQLN